MAPAHGEGMTHAEIAEATGLPLSAPARSKSGAALQSLPWSRFRTANRFPPEFILGPTAVGPGAEIARDGEIARAARKRQAEADLGRGDG